MPHLPFGDAGFYARSGEVLELARRRTPPELRDEERKYLEIQFTPSRDRMGTIANTIGTAGSFLLALVAILVSLATGIGKQADEVISATETLQQTAAGCAEMPPRPTCTETRLQQQQARVEREQIEIKDIADRSLWQAFVGGFVLLGFLSGLASHLFNPIPSERALTDNDSIDEWEDVRTHYVWKRRPIILAFIFQGLATVFLALFATTELL